MARQSSNRRNAEEPKADRDEVAEDVAAEDAEVAEDTEAEAADLAAEDEDAEDAEDEEEEDEEEEAADDGAVDRSLWDDTNVDPVEIALPAGVGYTLRAYRLSTELTPTDIEGRDDADPFEDRLPGGEVDDDEVVILDEEFAALLEEESKPTGRGRKGDDDSDEPDLSDDEDEDEDTDKEETAETDEEEEEAQAEEVPIFLSHRGKLLLFKSPESLVAFVRSGAPHDLAQLDSWSRVAERVQPAQISADDDDSYELDLVVENLRGGHDTWDLNLLINAGEIARDLAYALRLTPVLTALSAGSPLDDLDEALRAAAEGGFAGFRGRRRLRRIGAQQASLGWRSVIGKISAAVDWRD